MLSANGGPTAGQSRTTSKVSCASHREPRADARNSVAGAEEDEEDSDTKTRHPCVRASEAVREQQNGQRDQSGERELDDVEASEPGRRVHQGLHVHLRLGMDDLETRDKKWWR
jgi:hypothetical protein